MSNPYCQVKSNANCQYVYSCEHYKKNANRDHFIAYNIDDGSYDVEYIEAILTDDLEEIAQIEHDHGLLGFGPLTKCTTVSNAGSQRLFCRKCYSVF